VDGLNRKDAKARSFELGVVDDSFDSVLDEWGIEIDQFVCKASFIRAFQQSRAERFVDSKTRIHNLFR